MDGWTQLLHCMETNDFIIRININKQWYAYLVAGNEFEHPVAGDDNKTIVLCHIQYQLLRLREYSYGLREWVAQAPTEQVRPKHQDRV